MNRLACGAENRPGRTADARLATAVRELQEIQAPLNVAQILLDHAELLTGAHREDEAAPLLALRPAVAA
jgi:hypothetical protein